MKGFIVSMISSLRAYTGRLFHVLSKATAPGRVNAPGIHPRLIVGPLSLNISKINTSAVDSAGIVSIVNWRS